MLAFPGFTRSLIDSILDDDLSVQPMEFICSRPDADRGTVRRQHCRRPFGQLQLATPTIADNKFNLSLDLHQFKPEEVQIKFDKDNMLQVSGKREVKSEDGSSYEYREYAHHFTVPENVEHEKITSRLDANGVLKIEAPLKRTEALEEGARSIPIEFVRKH